MQMKRSLLYSAKFWFATEQKKKRAQILNDILNKTKSQSEPEGTKKTEWIKDIEEESNKSTIESNAYVMLIRKMQKLQNDSNRELTQDEIKEIMNDIEMEESDEEYVEKVMTTTKLEVKFRRPPKTQTEILKTLKEADQRFEMNKEFLAGGKEKAKVMLNEEVKSAKSIKSKRSLLDNVPPGVTISRLDYPVYVKGKVTMSTVILLGVKQRAIIHASFVNDFLEAFKPETVFMQLPPDLPLFVRTNSNQDYKTKWFSFLNSGADVRFYVSSRPQYTSDLILNNKQRMKTLFENNIMPATDEFEVGSKCLYSKLKGLVQSDIKPDALLTPFLYSYNNVLNKDIQTVIGDMPLIVQRERYANALKLPQLKEILNETVSEWGDKANFSFNPMVKHSDVFMKPRVAYICEVLRQAAMVSQPNGTVAVFDHDMLPYIEQQWRILPRSLQSLEGLQKQPTPKARDPLKQETFLEFVEKQVILDVLFEPYMFPNFVQYNSFPYDPENFLGRETALLNVFTFWKHYQEKYVSLMNKASILEEEYNQWLQKEGQLFEEQLE